MKKENKNIQKNCNKILFSSAENGLEEKKTKKSEKKERKKKSKIELKTFTASHKTKREEKKRSDRIQTREKGAPS